jgi:hypothetical protein
MYVVAIVDETGTAIVPVLACVLNQLCIRNDRVRPLLY